MEEVMTIEFLELCVQMALDKGEHDSAEMFTEFLFELAREKELNK